MVRVGLVVLVMAAGCGAATVEQTPPSAAAIEVPDAGPADAGAQDFPLAVEPTQLPLGRLATIRGGPFRGQGWGPERVSVKVDGVPAEVTEESTDDALVVLVGALPNGPTAPGEAQRARVDVVTPDQTRSWTEVEVLPVAEPALPEVTHIDVGAAAVLPNIAVEGSSVTLYGQGFAADPGQVTVTFDGAAPLHPDAASASQLTVKVPATTGLLPGVLRQVLVRVQVGGVVSPGKKLWVMAP